MRKINKFFTLIELIVVIVVIGILAAVVIPNTSSWKQESSNTAVTNNIRNIQTSVDMYILQSHGELPVEGVTEFKPKPIDFEKLHPEQLRNLPKTKGVKYWIDAWGTVWGSHVDAPIVDSLSRKMTWSKVEGADKYRVYEISNYKDSKNVITSKVQTTGLEFIVETNKLETEKVEVGKAYVVSAVDENGFETAPVGRGYEGYKDNLIPINNPSTNGAILKPEKVLLGETAGQPFATIEIEHSDVVKTNNKNQVNDRTVYERIDSKYSSGKATMLQRLSNGSYGSVEYKFKGTGIDLTYFSEYNGTIMIQVDNNTPEYIAVTSSTVEQKKVKSIRDLTQGEHNVYIRVVNGYIVLDKLDLYGEDTAPLIENIRSYEKMNGMLTVKEDNDFIVNKTNNVITYKLSKHGYTTIKVTNAQNKLVKTILNNVMQTGGTFEHTVEWNGLDDSNAILPKGYYNYHMQSVGIDGDVLTEQTKQVFLSDGKEVSIIEAEKPPVKLDEYETSPNPHVAHLGVDAKYSGGGYVNLQRSSSGSYGYIEYEFSGTGLDIVFANVYNGTIDITIDGVSINSIPVTNANVLFKNTYSIRNLAEGEHTLVVKPSNGYIYIDYIKIYNDNSTPSLENIQLFENIPNAIAHTSNNSFVVGKNSIRVDYNLTKHGYTDVLVKDMQGRTIKNLIEKVYQNGGTGIHNVIWNGEDNNGKLVTEGFYEIWIDSTGIYGEKSATYKEKVYVANSNYQLLFEAESPPVVMKEYDPTNTNNVSYVINDTKYSGGKYLNLQRSSSGAYGYVEFTFEGTGMDIYFGDYNGIMQVTLDGNKNYTISSQSGTNTSNVASIRNLNSGTHTVIIKTTSGTIYLDKFHIY